MSTNFPDSRFLQAQQHHQAGRLPQAADLYRQLLADNPNHTDAHHLLGLIYSQLGAAELAITHLQQAVAFNGAEPTYRNNLGEALRRAGRLQEAITAFQQALALQPAFAEAHFNLANVYRGQGRLAEAVAYYQQAIAARPAYGRAHFNLGNTYLAAGQLQAAVAAYQEAVRLRPDQAEWQYNLALALKQMGDGQPAVAALQQAVAIQPNYVEAHIALAELLRDQQRINPAIQHFQQAAQLRPEDGNLHFQLGYLFSYQGQMDAAVHHYQQAAQLQPGSAEVRNNLGIAVQATGRIDKAISHFQEAITLNPRFANIHRNLGLAEKMRGNVPAAHAAYQQSLALEPADSLLRLEMETLAPFILASNEAIDRYRAGLEATLDRFLNQPFPIDLTQLHLGEACPPYVLVYQGHNDRPLKEKWAQLFHGRLPAGEPQPGQERPHLGFVVTHVHEGVFARSLKGILNRLPVQRFRLTIVCNRAAVAQFLKDSLANPAINFLVIPQQLDQAADAIRRANFDLLYYWEIGTDATNYFLPFFRLAPVQCTSWGWQVTSGIPQVDSYISSRLLEPADADDHYSESLVLLNTLLTHYERPPVPERPPAPAHYGFRDGQHLYFCAQSLLKIHPDFDPLAADILRRDPAGALIFVGLDDPYPATLLRDRLQQTMPDVMERVHILPRLREHEFLGLLSLADVVLDTRHYGGVNTTYQALAAATPIVTWPGAFQRGRYTAGAYQKMGLLDCVADSAESYVSKALQLGTDKAYRQQISRHIREASPVLFGDEQAAVELADYFDEAVARVRDRQATADLWATNLSSRRIVFIDPSTSDYAVDTPYHQPLGGTQSAICYLAEQLAPQGYQVYLLSRNSRPRIVREVTCLALPERMDNLLDLVRWLAVDTVVVSNAALPPMLAALRQRSRLLLWTQHAHDQPGISDLSKPAFRDLWDAFIFVSGWQQEQYLAHFGLEPGRCHVLPNAVSPAFANLFAGDEPILPHKRPYTLAYASTPYRGLDLLLDVFPDIQAAVPQAQLTLYSSMKVYQGGQTEAPYQALYDRARAMPGVNYVGSLPQPELAAALRQTAVLAYPNTYPETSCITVMEATAAGCQVVTSDLGALPETTAGFARLVSWENGPEAYRVNFTQAVIEALQTAAEDPLRRQVDYVNHQYRWDGRANQWLTWLEQRTRQNR
jgi:protein O-GlcNAc transferase